MYRIGPTRRSAADGAAGPVGAITEDWRTSHRVGRVTCALHDLVLDLDLIEVEGAAPALGRLHDEANGLRGRLLRLEVRIRGVVVDDVVVARRDNVARGLCTAVRAKQWVGARTRREALTCLATLVRVRCSESLAVRATKGEFRNRRVLEPSRRSRRRHIMVEAIVAKVAVEFERLEHRRDNFEVRGGVGLRSGCVRVVASDDALRDEIRCLLIHLAVDILRADVERQITAVELHQAARARYLGIRQVGRARREGGGVHVADVSRRVASGNQPRIGRTVQRVIQSRHVGRAELALGLHLLAPAAPVTVQSATMPLISAAKRYESLSNV